MGSPHDIEESLLDLSETYIDAGMYTETVEVMSRLQASTLHGEHLPRYYHIYRTVFNALANNCASNSKKSEYVELVDRYRDSLKMCLTPDDIAYLYVVTDQLIAEREYEAVHEKAILAYSLGIAYRGIGDLENAERYLTISAINDLSTPIKEYQSLQELWPSCSTIRATSSGPTTTSTMRSTTPSSSTSGSIFRSFCGCFPPSCTPTSRR